MTTYLIHYLSYRTHITPLHQSTCTVPDNTTRTRIAISSERSDTCVPAAPRVGSQKFLVTPPRLEEALIAAVCAASSATISCTIPCPDPERLCVSPEHRIIVITPPLRPLHLPFDLLFHPVHGTPVHDHHLIFFLLTPIHLSLQLFACPG